MLHEVDSLGQSQDGRLSRLAEVLVVWFGFHNCHVSGLRRDLGLCALVETNPSCPLLGLACVFARSKEIIEAEFFILLG